MKKIIKMLCLIFALILIFGCGETPNPPQTDNKILVKRMYGDTVIDLGFYSQDGLEIDDYSKEGFEFKGWYLDKDFTVPYNSENIKEYFENDKELDLYAKMERIMIDFKIDIYGEVEGCYVLNPAFSWENNNKDSSFTVDLILDGETIQRNTVEDTYFQVKSYLSTDKEYTLKVTGGTSQASKEIKFKTIKDAYNKTEAINLANPFTSGMVIQRDQEIEIKGTASKVQLISVEFDGERYFTVSDEAGAFNVTVPAQPASFNPIKVVVSSGMTTKTLSDVLIGDVFLFAGQSNMQWPTKDADFQEIDVTHAKDNYVRFFSQDVVTSTTPKSSVTNGKWWKCDDSNYKYFSAIAFMSGAILSDSLRRDCPIGIVTAYQGNTNIADWMGDDYYHGTCSTRYLHYNAMVYPLSGTKLKGVVWYQGCNNSAAGGDYKDLLIDLFANYRDLFNSPDMPFYVIGLACYDGDAGNNYDFSYVREAQAMACKEDSNAYFISTCDDGDPTYIHPYTKRYICERVAKSVLGSIYGRNYQTEGPSYASHTVDGDTVTITLNNAQGLFAKGEIKGLYLAGSDGKYYEAEATIVGETIVAKSSKVANPVYIKYGFGKSPFVNIFNKDRFAITPFRTDVYDTNIDWLNYSDTSVYTFHPNGSAMTVEIVDQGLKITKANDGKGYGSVRLTKWGMIGYNPTGIRITLTGTNSGANIIVRAIEGGTYEIWGYKILDNFTGSKTFELNIGDFIPLFNKMDGKFNTQMIEYVEIMIEGAGEVTTTIEEVRFVEIEKTAPLTYTIDNVTEKDETIEVSLSKAVFADEYKVWITEGDLAENVYEGTSTDGLFIIPKDTFKVGSTYYVYAEAKNELGTSLAKNNGFVFYLKDESSVVICNFDFKDQTSLNEYVSSSMDVNAGLSCVLDANGVKIVSGGAGWQQFIFKLSTGIADGMTKLKFKMDLTNYKGTVVMQIADTNWNVYQGSFTAQEGMSEYVMNLSDFKKGSTAFSTETLMWVMFNFSDSTGNGYIILDDVQLGK